VYRYAQKVNLPKGTTITMRYTYDNSEGNPLNPHRPPERVQGGNRAVDEMAHLWLQVLPDNITGSSEDPRMLLEAALSQHQVDKDADDFIAQYNLASMLRNEGKLRDALTHYSVAARLRPEDPNVRNALASALLQQGDLSQAVQHLTDAIRLRPQYFDAQYNLALALVSENRFSDAAQHFAEAVRLKPDDAQAHANLGAALAELGKLREAKLELEQALKLRPGDETSRENLDQIKKMLSR
jgi:Flp pilus assembly protein TadD